jgi:hypothetical protein
MRWVWRLGLMIGLAALLSLAVGCGGDDDDGTTGSTSKSTGSMDDPEFEAMGYAYSDVESFRDMLMESALFAVDSVLSNMPPAVSGNRGNELRNALGTQADSVFMGFHSGSNYWYLFMQADEPSGSDVMTITLEDSVQFLHATGPVQWPDTALLTGINTGTAITMYSSGGDSAAAHQALAFTGELLSEGDIQINGTQSYWIDYYNDGDTCAISLDMNATINDINLNTAILDSDGCPTSGSFVAGGNVSVVCTGTPAIDFSDTWSVNETFIRGDSISYVVENSTTRWRWKESCSD